jgi:outer membrane protein assembly factor BamB
MAKKFGAGITLLIALTLLLASSRARAWSMDMPVLWRADLATLLESTAVAADVNGDGLDEIVAAGREEMYVLDGTGKVLWQWRTKGRFMTDPAVFQSPDKGALLYAADNQGLLSCLDGAGKVVWQSQLKGPSVWSGSVVGTLEPGGRPVVIQTDSTGMVWAFDYADGRTLWQAQVLGAPVTPAVGDVNGDGRKEIVVVTDKGELSALHSNGTPCWKFETEEEQPLWVVSSPVVFLTAKGETRIVTACSEDRLGCLNGQGQLLWTRPVRGGVDSSISVCDFDDDGKADIFLATQLGVIYRYTEDGDLRWDIDMQGRSLAPGALIDINNDGRLEYVLCTQNGRLMVLDQSGQFLFEEQFPHRTIGVTPAFGHFTKDSTTLQAAITGGESGLLLCLDTPAYRDTRAEWPAYRRDTCNTGFWSAGNGKRHASMASKSLEADSLFAGDDVEFLVRLDGPADEAMRAEATCIAPDGARRSSISRIVGTKGELRLPVDLSLSGPYRFSWSLTTADGTEACSGSRDVQLRQFANEMKLAETAVADLEAAIKATEQPLPRTATALHKPLEDLKGSIAELDARREALKEDDAPARAELAGKIAGMVPSARRAVQIARLFTDAAALPAGTTLLAFEGTTWESRAVPAQLPPKAAAHLKINRRLVPGEHDALPVLLFNITDKDLAVRVRQEADTDPQLHADLLHSVPVPTSLGETSWDPLPPLDDSKTLIISPLQSHELWLDVDASQAPPGSHALALSLHTAEETDAVTEIVAEYTVLPFEMASPGAFRLCAWANAKDGDWEDMLAHGNNVFIAPLPELRRDAAGKLAESDFSKLDAVLDRVKGHDVMMLLSGVPVFSDAVGTEGCAAELKPYLDQLVRHMAERDIDPAHFALYPFDEPGGSGWNAVNGYVAFGKAVREANPSVLIYVDGGCELPMARAMQPVTDIWTPSIYQLPEKSEVMEIMRGSGKTLWSYNCGYGFARPVGANLKNINVVGEFRNAALFALNYGATGIGFWSYNIGDDLWKKTEMEYPIVYSGPGKPVASRRWKAVREGIEDARIFMALKERAAKTQNAALHEKMGRLAGETIPALMNQSCEEMRLGLARYVLDATNNDATVESLRGALMDCAELAGADR